MLTRRSVKVALIEGLAEESVVAHRTEIQYLYCASNLLGRWEPGDVCVEVSADAGEKQVSFLRIYDVEVGVDDDTTMWAVVLHRTVGRHAVPDARGNLILVEADEVALAHMYVGRKICTTNKLPPNIRVQTYEVGPKNPFLETMGVEQLYLWVDQRIEQQCT